MLDTKCLMRQCSVLTQDISCHPFFVTLTLSVLFVSLVAVTQA